MTDQTPDDRLTVREVAALLGLTADYVRTLFYSNAIPAEVDDRDGNYRARRADVEAYRDGRLHADPHPMFVELGGYADRIAAAQKAVDDLIVERNRAAVRWVDERGQSVTAAAKAARYSRDRMTILLKVTRAKLAEERAKLARRGD